jgi:predicted lipoprotein
MRPKSIFLLAVWIIVAIGLMAAIWTYGFTVVSIKQVQIVEKNQTFDPVQYVDAIWATKIIPTITDKAVDLPTILNAMHPDAAGHTTKAELLPIAKSYGLITVGEAHVYMVKGTGRVVAMDTSSNTGTMEIQLDNYSGPIKLKLYIGPIIPADDSSIRDSVGFINFGDFQDQTQYGKVAAEINTRVEKEALSPLNGQNLQGKTISFAGAFTIRTFNLVVINISEINIVPIMITVEQ